MNTTAIHTTAPCSTVGTTAYLDALEFLSFLYQSMRGWCNIGFCIGEPSADTFQSPFWLYVDSPDSFPLIASEIERLTIQHGNVYISRTLHTAKSRTKATALPSPCAFIDDIRSDATVPFSLYVSTGTSKGQGWYRLAEPPTVDDNERISHAIAIHNQADHGFSITKMVRVPGTRNTKAKHGGNYAVHVDQAHSSGEIVTLEQLRAAYPESVIATHQTITTELNRQSIELMLGNINLLLDSEGLPTKLEAPSKAPPTVHGAIQQARENFKQWKENNFFNTKVQRVDTTGCRFTAAKSLAYQYNEIESAALLLHFIPDPQKRGEQWLWNDIASCISIGIAARKANKKKLDKADYEPKSSFKPRKATNKPQRIVAEPVQHRPSVMTAARLFRFYQEQSQADLVPLTIKEVAAQLNTSERTIQRIERRLRDGGMIERSRIGRHGSQLVILTDTYKDDLSPAKRSIKPRQKVFDKEVLAGLNEAKTDTNVDMGTHLLAPIATIGKHNGLYDTTNVYPCFPQHFAPTADVLDTPAPTATPTAPVPSLAMAVEFVPLDLEAASAEWDGGTLRRWCELGGHDFDRVMRLVSANQTTPRPSITTHDSVITIHAGISDTNQPQRVGALKECPRVVPVKIPSPNESSQPDPQPARPSRIYGPNLGAEKLLIAAPGYLEMKKEDSARLVPQPKPAAKQPEAPAPTVATSPPVLLQLPNPSQAQRHKRRNLSAVPFSALRDDETIAQAYDRLFGG